MTTSAVLAIIPSNVNELIQTDEAHFKYDSFTPVASRKKKKRKGRAQAGVASKPPRSPTELVEKTLSELHADSDWTKKTYELVHDALKFLSAGISNCLCLGLGSPTESLQARFQFCFLLQLRDKVLTANSPASISAFDPAFSSSDSSLLDAFGIKVLTENQNGRHVLDGPTLVFMPHCDLELYEHFLRANWSKDKLGYLLLIGNELLRYTESTPSRILGSKYPCVHRIAPLVVSAELPQHSSYPNAFSSMAVQHVKPESLLSQSDDFWSLPGDVYELGQDVVTVSPL